MRPAIVISAYNRPKALARLLTTIARGDYPDGDRIPLVISIDQAGAHPEVTQIAEAFAWPWGPKEVLAHKDHLGPLEHFYACGALSEKYGAIIFLEDDLIVSPQYANFARQALSSYGGDPCIAGVSLYALWFNGYTLQPFIPLEDASDTFFLQIPYTQGLAFTGEMWAGFRAHFNHPDRSITEHKVPVHEAWSHFKSDEWFPSFTRYLVSSGKYFAFPRLSLSSGAGDAGTHFTKSTGFFQTPLERAPREYRFGPLSEAIAVYDSFFELLPDRLDRLTTVFKGYDYTVDLYATRSRQNIQTPYILTTRPCRNPMMTFGRGMRPMEANLEYGNPGEGINFCRAEDLRWDWRAEIQLKKDSEAYFSRGKHPGLKTRIFLGLFSIIQSIQQISRR